MDIYLTNQFTPPLLRELRLFFPDFKYALEGASDFILAQKRRITIFAVFVPLIAVPNIISFGIAAVMPDLMTVEPAAVRTNELVAERASVSELCLVGTLFCENLLNTIKDFGVNDRLMGMLYKILLDLAAIFSHLFAEIIFRIGLLQ